MLPTLIVASCLALCSSEAVAHDAVSADVAALGGAAVAEPRDNSVITVNPAGIALEDQFDLQLGFVGGFDREWQWSASVVDGRTNPYVHFGIDYTGAIRFPPFLQSELPGWSVLGESPINRREDHHITLAAAVPLLDRRLSFGLNGTLSILSGPTVDQQVTGNMDLGVSTMPIPELSLGFVAKSVLPVADQPRTPGSVAFGVRGMLPDILAVTAEAEYRYEDVQRKPWAVRAGLQGIIRDLFILRGGWTWDGDRATHHLTPGIGLLAKDVGTLSYTVMVPVIPNLQGLEVGHQLTLTLFTSVASPEEDAPIRWSDR